MNPTLSFWIGIALGVVATLIAIFVVAWRSEDPADELIITTHTESPGRDYYLVGLVCGVKTANSKLANRIGGGVASVEEEAIVLTDGRTAYPGDCIWKAVPEPLWP